MALDFVDLGVLLGVLLVAVALTALVLKRGSAKQTLGAGGNAYSGDLSEIKGSLQAIQSQVGSSIQQQNQSIANHMQRTDQQLATASSQSQKMYGEIQGKLATIQASAEQMKDLAGRVVNLQTILSSPKPRGTIAEALLENLIQDILPKQSYQIQYTFQSGERVDAMVRLLDTWVPIDAKFPLSNFEAMVSASEEKARNDARNRFKSDVRAHVRSIASKYIKPAEGTTDFAFMYIGSESVYYELIQQEGTPGEKGVLSFAQSQRVFPVSPSTLHAYLTTVAIGLRELRVEETAKEIAAGLAQVRKDLGSFQDNFETVGTHLSNAQKKYLEAQKRLGHVQARVEGLTELDSDQADGTIEPEGSG